VTGTSHGLISFAREEVGGLGEVGVAEFEMDGEGGRVGTLWEEARREGPRGEGGIFE